MTVRAAELRAHGVIRNVAAWHDDCRLLPVAELADLLARYRAREFTMSTISDDDADTIWVMHRAGQPLGVIAETFGLTPPYTLRIIRSYWKRLRV